MSDPTLWHFMSPLHPKIAPTRSTPEPIFVREQIAAPMRGPQRSGDVAETARYFLNRGIASPEVIAGLLEGWDRESVEAVIAVVELAEVTKRDQAAERPQPKAHAGVKSALIAMVVVPGFLAVAVFGGSDIVVSMPPYAAVYLDDTARTYIALPCMSEWRSRSGDQFALVRLSTASEAHKLRYAPDDACVQTGAFIEEESPISLLLIKLGILPPMKHWWDQQYRTENGIVTPGRDQ